MRSTIQCSCDRIVVKFRGFSSNRSHFFRVIGRMPHNAWLIYKNRQFLSSRPAEVSRASFT